MICQSEADSLVVAFARCQLSSILPCSERHSPDFIFAKLSKPALASYRLPSPSGCSPLIMYSFACSKYETASSKGRQRSTAASFFVPFATGHCLDANATASVAESTGAAPTSDTLAEGAKIVSAPGPGRRRLSRPFERALILGANFK